MYGMSKQVINRCFKYRFNGLSSFYIKLLKQNQIYFLWKSCEKVRTSSTFISSQKDNKSDDSEFEKLLNDNKYEELKSNSWRTTGPYKQVLLVMPRQKWGNKQMDVNYAKYLMSETISLVNTLPNMKVIDSVMISTLDVNKRQLFGSGNSQLLKQRVHSNNRINGVVFSLDFLNSLQISQLEKQLGVDANTKEAKLQIALAEIPYIRNNLQALERSGQTRQTNFLRDIGGFGQTWIETRKTLLNQRELKLKKLLNKIQSNREILRLNREKKQFPIIAVVGYTNSGKTSLIKALTDDHRLVPRNQLFATLDVTVHAGRLPSGLKVLFTDTIGFISEIPISLIHSFKSTLSEICCADLIVHVLDISHPNHRLQEQTVHKTLDDIEVPQKLKSSIIEVSNKIDLVEDLKAFPQNQLFISVTERIGLKELLIKIEESIIANTGRLEKVFRSVYDSNDLRQKIKFIYLISEYRMAALNTNGFIKILRYVSVVLTPKIIIA